MTYNISHGSQTVDPVFLTAQIINLPLLVEKKNVIMIKTMIPFVRKRHQFSDNNLLSRWLISKLLIKTQRDATVRDERFVVREVRKWIQTGRRVLEGGGWVYCNVKVRCGNKDTFMSSTYYFCQVEWIIRCRNENPYKMQIMWYRMRLCYLDRRVVINMPCYSLLVISS